MRGGASVMREEREGRMFVYADYMKGGYGRGGNSCIGGKEGVRVWWLHTCWLSLLQPESTF